MCIIMTKRTTIITFAITLLFAGVLAAPFVSKAVAPITKHCGTLDQSKGPPYSGYGAAYDVFEPSKLMVHIFCPSDSSAYVLLLGSGGQDEIIYNKAYYYAIDAVTRQPMWKELSFSGGGKPYGGDPRSPWRYSYGVAYIGPNPTSSGPIKYVVGYICKAVGGQWKCGCSDTTCAEGKWQLQIVGTEAERVTDTGPGSYCHIATELQPGKVIDHTVRKYSQICAGLPGNYHIGAQSGNCERPRLSMVAGEKPADVALTKTPIVMDNFGLSTTWTDLQGVVSSSARTGDYLFTLAKQKFRWDDDTDTCEFLREDWRQDYKVTVLPPADYVRLDPIALSNGKVNDFSYHASIQLPAGYQGWEVTYVQKLKELPCCNDVSDAFPARWSNSNGSGQVLNEGATVEWWNTNISQALWKEGTYVMYFVAIRRSDYKQVALPITLKIEP